MRLVSFLRSNKTHYGRVIGDVVHGLAAPLGLRSYLSGERDANDDDTGETWRLEDLELLPPIADPGKILCVGLNYHEHVQETGREPVGYPTIFTRFADTQVGSGASIRIPLESERVDYEGELAVVIGKPGRRISENDAMRHIGAYGCYNDVSVRDWQKHGAQWTPGKNFPATGAFGPCLVSADEVPDPSALRIETRVNGKVLQSASTGQLIFSLPFLISYISQFTPLSVGDVICTGTPGGVGFTRDPPIFLRADDVVEVEIEKIGVLRNPVTKETCA